MGEEKETAIAIEGIKTYQGLTELTDIHTVTMYVSEDISNKYRDDLIHLNPKRVIFNPGSENHALAKELKEKGIEVLEACTLVMLSTDQF